MDAAGYRRYTEHLVAWARRHPDVRGLVALGSTADASRHPDVWSDHDVWVVVTAGAASALRDDPSWLPEPERIIAHFFETEHGRSVVYDDGHLLELAVFEEPELELTRANDYRVLYDGGGIEERMVQIAARTAEAAAAASGDVALGLFVTRMLIGLGRYGRGEVLSANQLVRGLAVESLLGAVARYTAPASEGVLDDLDPHRRFETAYPALAARVDRALGGSVVDVAQVLLHVAAETTPMSPEISGALQAAIDRARAARPPATRLHHVQLAMPPGGEESARRFYSEVLGLAEVVKPAALAARGGCWFGGDAIELHLGVADPFVPATQAHPGILVADLDDLARRLGAAGYEVRGDPDYPGHRRFYTDDPFGNRIEFLQRE